MVKGVGIASADSPVSDQPFHFAGSTSCPWLHSSSAVAGCFRFNQERGACHSALANPRYYPPSQPPIGGHHLSDLHMLRGGDAESPSAAPLPWMSGGCRPQRPQSQACSSQCWTLCYPLCSECRDPHNTAMSPLRIFPLAALLRRTGRQPACPAAELALTHLPGPHGV